MNQYLLTISDNKAALSFLDFIKNLDFVQKVEQVKESFEPLSKEDWIKPGRPATDEEFEQMLNGAENSKDLSLNEAKESLKHLNKADWTKPGRHATKEEFEQMIAEMEEEERAGLGMVAEKAEEYATKRIEEWQKKSK